jgi:hypothetical protein|tara:strand:- start:3709 stop:4011 length:303 start_codon:yes stop_codon:yes gene_type:complete
MEKTMKQTKYPDGILFELDQNELDRCSDVYDEPQEEFDSEKLATLFASAPAMLELLKNILAEVRPEISRVNEAAGETIFNPVATETIDMAKELIAKAGGE